MVKAEVIGGSFTRKDWAWRFAVAIALDALDMAIGWIPVVGFFLDLLLGFVGVWLWGKVGGLQWLELLEMTNIIDMAIPTLTISGIIKYVGEWRAAKRADAAQAADAA